jgi:hypothetical protein
VTLDATVGPGKPLPSEVDAEPAARIEERAASVTLALLPGALVVYFAFEGGGYFAGSVGFIALLLTQVLVVRVLFAEDVGFGAVVPCRGPGARGVRPCPAVPASAAAVRAPASATLADAVDDARTRRGLTRGLHREPRYPCSAEGLADQSGRRQQPPELSDHVLERARDPGVDRDPADARDSQQSWREPDRPSAGCGRHSGRGDHAVSYLLTRGDRRAADRTGRISRDQPLEHARRSGTGRGSPDGNRTGRDLSTRTSSPRSTRPRPQRCCRATRLRSWSA